MQGHERAFVRPLLRAAGAAAFLVLSGATSARAADWPTYRADAGRTGYTPEELPARLSLHWTYEASHPPSPAWTEENRLPFDRAYHVVAAGGMVYFGSSADCKVYALDASTGKERWSFTTDGPVRFAPAVWKDRLFAVSDDGHLYCLAAADGRLLWKRRPGPEGRMILGNGRMISKWPARGGPAVVDDKVYFGAGIWPSEGVHICALQAATGKKVWTNDTSGSLEMSQPHGGARAKSGTSCQGYLVAAEGKLLVPTGRAVPAAFDLAGGKFLYFHLQKYGHAGGTTVAAIDTFFFNAGRVFRLEDGRDIASGIASGTVAAGPRLILYCSRGKITALDRAGPFDKVVVRGRERFVQKVKWSAGCEGGTSLIVAGRTAFSGGEGSVTAFDMGSRKPLWTKKIDGTALGLAAAGGRLFVSTEKGAIICFGSARARRPAVIRKRPAPHPAGGLHAEAAKEIVNKTGITEGYCLDLGCGDGRLAYELARRTELRIYAIDKDPANVALARKRLDAAGVYGVRVTVHQGDPARTPYPNYFADLVVSGRSVSEGTGVVSKAEALRVARPWGGAVITGRVRAMSKSVRGPLEGAGSWTHQYADPANTASSGDAVAKGPLTILWFGGPDQVMANRHGRAPAPLFSKGRLFVQGRDGIRALDAYNGRVLWEFSLRGVTRPYDQEHLVGVAATGGNICVRDDVLYVGTAECCLRIDAKTGGKLGEFKAPPRPGGGQGTWGYVACSDGILFGTVADEKHIVRHAYRRSNMKKLFTESALFFAMDARTGGVKWSHRPKNSIRHNAIAVGGGKVYLIDRPRASFDRLDYAIKKGEKLPEHPTGELVVLDAATGRQRWKRTEDIYGTTLILSTRYDVLLMSYQPTRFRLRSELGGRFTAFRASSGRLLYDLKARYSSRPVVNDRTIYAEPGAWDLLTGSRKGWRLRRSYGCGTLAGGRHILTFRSGTLGYVDLLRDRGTENFGGIRPGCWINAIPAGGLILMPDYTDRCGCSYLIKTSIALEPKD